MDCSKHEDVIKEIEHLKHCTQSNQDKIHNLQEYTKGIEDRLHLNINKNIEDRSELRNLSKLFDNFGRDLHRIADAMEKANKEVKTEIGEVRKDVNEIKSNLKLNDYKTDTSVKELTKVNSFIRNMNGLDVAKIIGLMIAFGGLIVSILQAIGGVL